jgi:transmembrane sensor
MTRSDQSRDDETIRRTAARWTVRRDRGLSAAESIDYELWLAADPRHRAAMEGLGAAWARLDGIPEHVARPVLAAGRRRTGWWRIGWVTGALAAAAAGAFVAMRPVESERMEPVGTETIAATEERAAETLRAAGPRLVALADGTEVRLNAGSEIVERFSAAERGVELTRGEAHFTVTKDPARPFVVRAGAVRVRAVGTAFNVSRGDARTEVLVTEGRVALLADAEGGAGLRAPAAATAEAVGGAVERGADAAGTATETLSDVQPGEWVRLGAGDTAVITAAPAGATAPEIAVTRVDAAGIARALAWQESLVRLGGATLGEIAAEFGRRTGHRVVLADPELGQVRLGGRFRADDVEGFAKLLTTMLDVDVERSADGAIVLRRKK